VGYAPPIKIRFVSMSSTSQTQHSEKELWLSSNGSGGDQVDARTQELRPGARHKILDAVQGDLQGLAGPVKRIHSSEAQTTCRRVERGEFVFRGF